MDPDEEIIEEPTSPEVEEQKKREKAFAQWLRELQPRMFPGLIGACVFIWLMTELAGGSTRPDVLVRFGALSGPLLELGEWWRLMACGFLHIGLIHLLANMWAVYALGAFLERFYGPWRLLALFTFAVLGGSIGGVLATPLQPMAGASGGIFGWFGAIIVIYFKYRDKFTDRWKPVQWWIWQVVVLNLIIALIVPGLSHAAHLGGCLFGALFAMMMPSRPGFIEPDKPWAKPLAAVSLLLVPSLGMALLHTADNPWEFGWKPYKDDKFEIQYPESFGHEKDRSNIVFWGLGVRVDVGVLSPEEQQATKRGQETLTVVLPEATIWLSKVEPLLINGEAWTRYVGKMYDRPWDAYVHEASQWHVFAWGLGGELDEFRPSLRKMAESFRLK
jgi:rhomboid protease GluP